jgi:methionine-rich copper-binding protein CopC
VMKDLIPLILQNSGALPPATFATSHADCLPKSERQRWRRPWYGQVNMTQWQTCLQQETDDEYATLGAGVRFEQLDTEPNKQSRFSTESAGNWWNHIHRLLEDRRYGTRAILIPAASIFKGVVLRNLHHTSLLSITPIFIVSRFRRSANRIHWKNRNFQCSTATEKRLGLSKNRVTATQQGDQNASFRILLPVFHHLHAACGCHDADINNCPGNVIGCCNFQRIFRWNSSWKDPLTAFKYSRSHVKVLHCQLGTDGKLFRQNDPADSTAVEHRDSITNTSWHGYQCYCFRRCSMKKFLILIILLMLCAVGSKSYAGTWTISSTTPTSGATITAEPPGSIALTFSEKMATTTAPNITLTGSAGASYPSGVQLTGCTWNGTTQTIYTCTTPTGTTGLLGGTYTFALTNASSITAATRPSSGYASRLRSDLLDLHRNNPDLDGQYDKSGKWHNSVHSSECYQSHFYSTDEYQHCQRHPTDSHG